MHDGVSFDKIQPKQVGYFAENNVVETKSYSDLAGMMTSPT
jgi:hypothetical protein